MPRPKNPGDVPTLLDLSSGRRITLQNAATVIGPRFVRNTPFLVIEDWTTPPRDLLAWDTHSGACAYRLPAPPPGPGIGSITYTLAGERTVARLFSTATAGTYRLDVFELPDPRTP